MANLEFKLDTKRIKAKQEQEKILKEKWDSYHKKHKLNQKLQIDLQKHQIQLEMMPNFYQLRPIDERLQLRHQAYKLSPIANTPAYNPLQNNNAANIVYNNQFLSVRFNMGLRKKILINSQAEKKHQDQIDNAQRYTNQMTLTYGK